MDEQPQYDIEELTPDLARLRIAFVNVYLVGTPAAPHVPWVLVDAGLPMGAARILDVAAARFGRDARPRAIVLTHGHFDHVGALEALLGVWDVPVYAHSLEVPFLTGRADYPPPDASLGSVIARLAPLFPERGLNLGDRVHALAQNRHIPGMPGWKWVRTPGQSPGHVSFFRGIDRVLIAGDAITTTQEESVFAVGRQREALNGPPAYFTIDWERARRSIATIASLKPKLVAAGHGPPMRGPSLAPDLAALARDFDQRVRPARGRYVAQAALTNDSGIVALPPAPRSGGVRWGMLSGVAAATFAGTWLFRRFGRRSNKR